jgi:hypothetical protein
MQQSCNTRKAADHLVRTAEERDRDGNAQRPGRPDVRISRIRLSDWLHREAHERNH